VNSVSLHCHWATAWRERDFTRNSARYQVRALSAALLVIWCARDQVRSGMEQACTNRQTMPSLLFRLMLSKTILTWLLSFATAACADHGSSPPEGRSGGTTVAGPGGIDSRSVGGPGAAVPEPGVMLLVGAGLVATALFRRRRRAIRPCR